MKSALRLASSTLGIYAGLLGMQHGFFEVRQGNVAPAGGWMIHAIGAPCQPEAAWHACYPAFTLIPNVFWTGVLALAVGLSLLVWAVAFIQRERGGPVLMLLSLLLFIVGGGFVPAVIGVIAGAAACRFHLPLNGWRLSALKGLRSLAGLWPWPLVLMGIWLPGSWLVGHFFSEAMRSMTLFVFLFFDIGLPVLSVLVGFAADVQKG
ncbi:MAG: hypothetical protein GYA59_15450, partial [Chloroflexi bacterium]|nr:hypothetical protein [Chloroflexota bacterium]